MRRRCQTTNSRSTQKKTPADPGLWSVWSTRLSWSCKTKRSHPNSQSFPRSLSNVPLKPTLGMLPCRENSKKMPKAPWNICWPEHTQVYLTTENMHHIVARWTVKQHFPVKMMTSLHRHNHVAKKTRHETRPQQSNSTNNNDGSERFNVFG